MGGPQNKTAPQTLPADFDFSKQAPDTLPADFNFETPVASHKTSEYTPGTFRNIVENINASYGVPVSVSRNPKEGWQGIKMAVSHPSLEVESLKQMYQGMTKQQQDVIDEAYSLQNAPGIDNKVKGWLEGIYASVPVIGPAYVNALKQYQSGDRSGALGSMIGLATQVLSGGLKRGEKVPTVEGTAMEAGAGLEPKPPVENVRATPGHFRRVAQETLRAGPSVVREAGEKYAGDLAKREDQVARNQRAADIRNERATAKHTEATAQVDQANRAAIEEHAQKVRDVEAQNRLAAEDYASRVQEEKDAITQRRAQAKTIDEKSAQLGKSIENLEKKVGAEADRRFQEVKDAIGNPEASPNDLIAATKNAEGLLQGVPENIKEFRRILGMEGEGEGPLAIGPDRMVSPGEPGYEAVKQAYVDQGLLKETEPLTWDKLQSLKSRLDARLRGPKARTLNGDVKRALYAVREATVDEMGKMADEAGAGGLWDEARDFWRQYKEDFYTPTGPSGSGSPVAQAFDAVDPKNVRQPFLRTQSEIGNRGIDILRKYADYGGNDSAKLAGEIVEGNRALREAPKVKAAGEPPSPKARPGTPQLKPSPKAPAKVQPTEVRPVQEPNIAELREKQILKKTADWKAFSKWEIGAVPLAAADLLRAPFVPDAIKQIAAVFVAARVGEQIIARIAETRSVVDWLNKPTAADFNALRKLPPEVQNKLAAQLRQAAMDEQAATGKKLNVGPEMARYLATGVAAGAAGSSVRDLRERAKQNAAQ